MVRVATGQSVLACRERQVRAGARRDDKARQDEGLEELSLVDA